MSRHSRNCTSQSIFTYGEKQKLKGEYGTKQQRIGQDSVKKFQMCTICNNVFIEPVCCTQGHVFCRSCAIEFMVRQKKKIAQMRALADQEARKDQEIKEIKQIEEKGKKAAEFEKYDNFEMLIERKKYAEIQESKPESTQINSKESKPVGIYQLTGQKQKYVRSSFWATENTPAFEQKVKKEDIDEVVKCPAGATHKLTLKKLRPLVVKKIEEEYCCGICNKEIRRQKIGSYKCGHIICLACKSDKCELCNKNEGWILVESSASAFAEHNKAQVKTYTHAFYI